MIIRIIRWIALLVVCLMSAALAQDAAVPSEHMSSTAEPLPVPTPSPVTSCDDRLTDVVKRCERALRSLEVEAAQRTLQWEQRLRQSEQSQPAK